MTLPALTLSKIAAAGLILMLCAPLGVGLAALSGLGHRWVDILAQFTGPALCAAALLTLIALGLRLWPAVVFGVATGLILLLAGWPQWFPAKGQAQAGAPVVTLYSANLLVRNTDAEAVRASIAEGRADIIVLIETPKPMLGQLDRLLPDHPYRVVETGGSYAVDGTVVASRWPVEKAEGLGSDNHLAARVQTPLGPVTVFAAHLTRPWPFQYQWGQISQTMALAEVRRDLTGPVIVAGDFNAVSSARIGRQVQAEVGVIPAPGFPGTWPTSIPAFAGITIDQVYRSPDLALLERRLGLANGSDHRPVVTRFGLARP
jgi:endonuclease/exonuclease/phosphatase (EEP) superfamily protein YafD